MSKSPKAWEHVKGSDTPADPVAERFIASLAYDTRLWRHDIAGSLAHANMLQAVGILSPEELEAIRKGLEEISAQITAAGVEGWSGWRQELEDVHMCLEAALIEKAGEAGRKLHTGRSRNDQVALDLKLWLAEAAGALEGDFTGLFAALVELALRDGELLLPAYTHLQRAQPITVGGEMVAWLTALDRCLARIMALAVVSSGNPLGSGAAAGSALPLARDHTAAALRVGEPSPSSLDATSARDEVVDFLYALAMTAMTLSRWAEQWILYSTSEFGFLRMGEAYTTGSSMMPQKRNPDVLELIRGRAGGVYGHLMAMLTLLKGLPLGYNRDLQEDKTHLFTAYDSVRDSLAMAQRIVSSAAFDGDRTAAACEGGFSDATSLAEYLVQKGTPFRTAHQQAGELVRLCTAQGVAQLSLLPLARMQEVNKKIDSDVGQWLGAANVVARYRTYGNAGTGYREILEAWRKRVSAAD